MVRLVTVSAKGQVVIPRDVRKRLKLDEGTRVRMEVTRAGLVLRPVAAKGLTWGRWRGHFRKRGLLKTLRVEHRQEIARDRKRGT